VYKTTSLSSQNAEFSPNLFTLITIIINPLNMPADTLSLAGKTALVTGSGRETGIGAAIARAFARNGASVAIHHVSEGTKGRAEKLADDISKEFGTKTTVVQGGVENYDNAKSMVEHILNAFGVDHIDILGT
jgi:NAD(P)-dependent dehydrogenase (short-subunit alcohol dehydrogenase family)